MLVALFASALFWNVLTWAFGIPNSSSHCIIGALIGVAASDALLQSRGLDQGVDSHQIVIVLEALAIALAQQDGWRGAPVADRFDIHDRR